MAAGKIAPPSTIGVERFQLDGKVALITGGSGDLGSEVARAISAAGATTVIAARTEAKLASVAESIRAMGGHADYFRCDLAEPAQIRELAVAVVQRHGGVDVLVNNAIPTRWVSVAPLDEADEATWELERRVIVDAARLLSHEVVPSMERRGGGSIINVGSSAGFNPIPGYASYGLAKGALLLLTKYQALEYGPRNIRANVVVPGTIEQQGIDMGQIIEQFGVRQWISLGRAGLKQEFVGAVVFLASDAASYISGQVLSVDGGRLVP